MRPLSKAREYYRAAICTEPSGYPPSPTRLRKTPAPEGPEALDERHGLQRGRGGVRPAARLRRGAEGIEPDSILA